MNITTLILKIGFRRLFFLLLYYGISQYLPRSSFPLIGRLSNQLRVSCCRHIFKKTGKNITIERKAFFGSGLNIEIGDYSGLGRNCFVQSDIIIGLNVMIGPNFYVHSRNHAYDDPATPIRDQGYKQAMQTRIGDDVWIGRDCMFTPGKHIKKGTVIAARSVVTKDYDEYSVIGGNPAKLIKRRGNNG